MHSATRTLVALVAAGACTAAIMTAPSASAVAAALPEPDRRGPGHQVLLGQQRTSLDGQWRFATDPEGTGLERGFAAPSFDDSDWDSLTVPGHWDLHDRYARYRGAGWYRRDFTAARVADGKVARLRFEAVYHKAEVWLNGERLGSHTGGYTPFEFDVTGLLRPGRTNTMVVRADNTYSIGAWWPWGGISRPVSLTVDPAVRVERQQVVAEPDLEAGTASVATDVTVSNASGDDQSVTVSGAITDLAGKPLPSGDLARQQVSVPAGKQVTVRLATRLDRGGFELWRLDAPRLYRATVQLGAGYAVSDRIGIRTVELRGTGFYLNGERVRLNGYNRVADDRVNGNTEPEFLVRRDIDRMKAAGANLTRIHHLAQAPAVLDYADEKGLLLIEEVPFWGKDDPHTVARWKPEMREMVRRDVNHPSIFAWSVANEIQGASEAGRRYVRDMMAYVRQELDSSRLLTYVSNTYWSADSPDDEALQYADFASVNMYRDFQRVVDHVHALYPDKPVYVSEFSPDGFEFPTSREDLDFRTGADAVVPGWAGRDFVMGASQWTYNDYRSSFRGTSTNEVRGWGVQTVWGGLKRAYHQMQAANAPVRTLRLSGDSDGDSRVTTLRVEPRGAVEADLPALTLRGYRLAWQATDRHGAVVAGRILDLPALRPGDQPWSGEVSWRDAGDAVAERVSLLSPTGYEVAVASRALRPPDAPSLRETVVAAGAVRAVFAAVPAADSYRVEVATGEQAHSAVTYRNDFADVTGLPAGPARVRVVAVNSAGETASPWREVDLPDSGGPLAPQALTVTPVVGGAVLGWSGVAADDSYDIEVSDARSGAVARTYRTSLRGASRIEQLTAGTRYALRIRSVRDGEPSAWSERRAVTPLGNTPPRPPSVAGVLSGADTLAVRLTPDPRAVRYEIEAVPDDGGPPARRTVEASAVGLIAVDGLRSGVGYTLRLRVHSPEGVSSPAVTTAVTVG